MRTALENLILTARGTLDPLKLKLMGGEVRRFHVDPEVAPQSVAEHSWRMMVILHHLWPERVNLLTPALLHDVTEGLLGDVPAPVKRWPGIKGATENLERQYEEFLGIVPIAAEDKLRIKTADYLELVAWCKPQQNAHAQRIAWNATGYLREVAEQLARPEAFRVLALLDDMLGVRVDNTGEDNPRGFLAQDEERSI